MESFFELKKEGLGECMSDKNRVVLVLKTHQISAIRKRLAEIAEWACWPPPQFTLYHKLGGLSPGDKEINFSALPVPNVPEFGLDAKDEAIKVTKF
jgi:hypothetical protein